MIFLLVFILFSCSSVKEGGHFKRVFQQKDSSGDFILTRESGFSTQDQFIVKGKLENDKVIEKTISIAKRENKLLSPEISQYTVWINKKKHFSEISYDRIENQLIIRLISADPQNNGVKFYPLKGGEKMCFFSQIIDCARIEGFLDRAMGPKDLISFDLIWDGFPFFNQLLENFPQKVFSKSALYFGGKNKMGDRRFILKVEGDEIIFELDSSNKLVRNIWISQGITIEKLNDI